MTTPAGPSAGLALYRKYRSATFAELIGQEHVTRPLSTALDHGRINHAYLFSGPRGCGKTSSARILARSLNCAQGPTSTPCGVCDSCRELAPNGPGSIDVIEIDAASHNGVDDARDLRERAWYAPVRDRYKVYIVDEAHMVTTAAFNALLKLVEEPPDFLVFVFATTEPEKVLQTIRSRTHHYPFRLVPPGVLRSHLEAICVREGVEVEPTVLPLVTRAGGGSVRDALSILDQLLAGSGDDGLRYSDAVGLLGVTDAALIDTVVDALAVGDAAAVFGAVDQVVEAGHDPRRFAADLLDRLRDLLILDVVPGAGETGLLDVPGDILDRMVDQARRLGTASVTRYAEIVHQALVDMRGTTAPRLVLELVCARMLLPDAAADTAAVLQRLEALERRASMTGPAPAAAPAAAPPVSPRGRAPEGAARPAAAAGSAAAGSAAAGSAAAGSAAAGSAAAGSAPVASRTTTEPASAVRSAATSTEPASAGAGPTGPASSRPASTGPAPSGSASTGSASTGPGSTGPGSAGPGSAEAASTASASEPGRPDPSTGSSRPAASRQAASREASASPGAPAPSGSSPRSGSSGSGEPATRPAAPAAAERPSSPAAADRPTPSSSPTREEVAEPVSVSGPSAATNPSPPSPVGSADVLDAARVRDLWSTSIVPSIKSKSTQALLHDAQVVAVEGTSLRLTIPHPPLVALLTQERNLGPIKTALQQALGGNWNVEVGVGGAGGGAGPAATPPPAPAPPEGSGSAASWSGTTERKPAPPDLAAQEPPEQPPPPDPEDPRDNSEPLGEPDPATGRRVGDPEDLAIGLLRSQLGARPVDRT